MTVEYLDLADFITIAAAVTGQSEAIVLRVANLDLADSALHSPSAGFGDTEFYPDFVDKAAVLLVHLATNHPLPDGNKRAAWVALRMFIEINEWQWTTKPTIDEAEDVVLRVASGKWSATEASQWLRQYLATT